MVNSDQPFAPENFTTHKDRAEWFSQRVSFPMRDADPCNLEAFYAMRRTTPGPVKEWRCMGPVNIGGRVTALVADPGDSNLLVAGTASGGVWTTDSGGRKWTTNWPQWFTSNIGSIAIDPHKPQVIYCGTGEANLSSDDYPGSGVFISENFGKTWRPLADAAEAELPRRIGVIAVDPSDPSGKVLYLGGVSHDDAMTSGLFRSADGGISWRRDNFFSKHNYQCTSIAFHPEGLVFTAILARGILNGIWRHSSKGWQHLANGLPPADKLGRISLAVAPSQPDTIYAIVADPLGNALLGVYCSHNKGGRWEQIDHGQLAATTQPSYNNAIAVSPDDPDLVACGGNDVFVTGDGGAAWTRASQWTPPNVPGYVHADVHAIVIPGRPFHERIYCGTDGGVFVTENLGELWEPRNREMVTTLFYSVAVAPTDSRVIGGGTQDNGSLLTGLKSLGVGEGEFAAVKPGDGAWMVIDPKKESHIFASNSEFRISRFRGDGVWTPVVPESMTPEERKQVPIARMALDPGPDPGGKTVWTASRRLWKTVNSGHQWNPVSPFYDGSAVTALDVTDVTDVAEANRRILIGTAKGGIFRSTDGGETWSGNLAGPEMPSRLISDFETHPEHTNVVVAAVAGSGIMSKLAPGAAKCGAIRLQHVFFSEDGGETWSGIDSEEMPDVACYSVVFEKHPPYRLFVSNDCGVWATSDYQHWTDWTGNLPTVRITMLVYHHDDRVLTAATYGRGVWRIAVPEVADTPPIEDAYKTT